MPLDPQIGNQVVTIESPDGTILGFRKEELSAKGVVSVELRLLKPEKTFQRTKGPRIDKGQLDIKSDDLPAWIATAPDGEKVSPEEIRLLEPVDKIGRDTDLEREIEEKLLSVGQIKKVQAAVGK